MVSTVILLCFYVVAPRPPSDSPGPTASRMPRPSDVLSVLGPLATGGFFGQVIILAVGISALAALMTVAVSNARTWLSMGTYGALPAAATKMHPATGRPTPPVIWWAGLSIAMTVVLTALSADFIGLAILSVGLMIAAYYAATALAASCTSRPRCALPPQPSF